MNDSYYLNAATVVRGHRYQTTGWQIAFKINVSNNWHLAGHSCFSANWQLANNRHIAVANGTATVAVGPVSVYQSVGCQAFIVAYTIAKNLAVGSLENKMVI